MNSSFEEDSLTLPHSYAKSRHTSSTLFILQTFDNTKHQVRSKIQEHLANGIWNPNRQVVILQAQADHLESIPIGKHKKPKWEDQDTLVEKAGKVKAL